MMDMHKVHYVPHRRPGRRESSPNASKKERLRIHQFWKGKFICARAKYREVKGTATHVWEDEEYDTSFEE
jgi:hypothetical protein